MLSVIDVLTEAVTENGALVLPALVVIMITPLLA
jgi:hypothetical protein